MQGGGVSEDRIQLECRPGNQKQFQISNRPNGVFSKQDHSRFQMAYSASKRNPAAEGRQFYFRGESENLVNSTIFGLILRGGDP